MKSKWGIWEKAKGGERKGSALVIVLSSLAFMAALALAFLASIGTELKSSRRYADGVSAQLLAQSAFSLVQIQIQEATKGYEGNVKTAPLAWASQPGMIRTYTAAGAKGNFYRLYSWEVLVNSGDFDPAAEKTALNGWDSQKAVFVDLNEPLKVGTETLYPIVNGNNLDVVAGIPGKTYKVDNVQAIDGFYVDGLPVAPSNANPVPMPVKWLYVLADGQMKAATYLSEKEGQVAGATADNPIVGRIAFWTDDESSKININTASEGVYWDTPRTKNNKDDILKINQPVTGEYQRYPGHPAMTSLSVVIKRPAGWNPGTPVPTFSGGSYADAVKFSVATPEQWLDYQWAQKLYGISPRIGPGGSYAGSVRTAMGIVPSPVLLDADRLYASVDELAFKPLLSSGNRISNNVELANLPILDKATLERATFFLTASSRSPDVNLFNKPRVSIWPLHAATDNRTAYDRLIAFCGSMGSGACTYYFQRSDPNSPTADLDLGRNRLLLTYLRTLAGENFPGFGGNFDSKYPQDKDQIFTEIFDYIRCTNLRDGLLAGDKTYTQGISGSPWAGTNGIGQVVPIYDAATDTRGFGRYPTLQGASVLFIGQVDGDQPLVPLDENYLPPAGPVPPADRVLNAQADPATGNPLPYWNGGTLVVDKVDPGKMRIQALFIPQFFCPSAGAVWMRSNFKWSVDLADLKLNGLPLSFPSNLSSGTPRQYTQNQRPKDETGFGDQLGMIQSVQASSTGVLSVPVEVAKANDMTLSGTVTFKIWAADRVASPPDSTTLLQTFTLNFNGPACPVPSLAYDYVANKQTNGASADTGLHYVNYRSFTPSTGRYDPEYPRTPKPVQGGRFIGGINSSNAGGFFMDGDAVRSVRLVAGDPRLAAARQSPPASLYEANPTADRLLGAHNFFSGYGHAYYGAGMGKLVKDLAYSPGPYFTGNRHTTTDGFQNVFFNQGYSPASDTALNGVEAGSNSSIAANGIPGDWDNSVMANRDGPFINKPDEGDSGTATYEPYFWKLKAQAPGSLSASLFSPNRQVPSAVTFGSLSTGVKSNRPWQTLLFRPEPGHPGSGSPARTPPGPPYTTPPDHLLLDLFTMPVVEPYAISEPMSTAGRINMNYQIVPFTYLNRDTGLRSLFKAEKVISINDNQVGVYKLYKYVNPWDPVQQYNIRFDVNAEETLKGFRKRFDSGDIFRSATEICDVHIVPKDDPGGSYPGSTLDTYDTMSAYWSTHRLTGDNSKERIYATLYPRLTTKSNTFTIYARVQTLKKIRDDRPDVWTEGRDQITGQYRGYQTVERFVDPNDPGIPDYAAGGSQPLGDFYKTRVLATKQFGP